MLRATYEHIIHVESFKNIDLFNQGLYYLRFMIKSNGEQATPYNYFETNNNKKKESWQPSQIDEQYFQTRTFMIRFQEEEVEIDESCIFKIEVSASPHYEHEFKLICELMCADLAKIGGPPNEESLFKCVATFQGRICNSYKGVHEYVPIMFDTNHFCQVHCTVNSNLQDFKFRLSEFQKANSSKISIQPKTFTEFLHKHTNKFTKSQEFFDYYIGQLRLTSESLQQQVAKLCGQLKLYEELSKLPTIPKFSYIQYQESSIIKENIHTKGNILISDVLNLKNIRDQNLLSTLIENDINQYSSVLFELQNILINIIQNNSKQYRILLQQNYQVKIKDKWGETYFREVIKCNSFSNGTLCQKQHQDVSDQIRRKPLIMEQQLDIIDENLFSDQKQATVLFEEIYQISQPLAQQEQILHLIVLVHGFQGNSLDMRLIKNNLQLQYPNHHYLMSRANEDLTDGNLSDMGQNLAQEVKQYILDWIKNNPFRISFLGHSMGGVIVRAALPHLSDFKINMNTYISLSSPHLGYGYNNSLLIDAGLWFLKRMRKSVSLQQLAMTDAEQIENTFLYQLSRQDGLNWFQNILFVSSAQDSYVPFESARISKNFERSDQNSRKYEKMVDNIFNGMRATQVRRLDVNFVLKENRTIDNMIGRSAHIMFLENQQLLRMLVTCVDDIFN
ncbi:unnamed protein product [Paramecium octaurelia]|uniref:DUF676 domain-containing protein n=1 Tax=Paramecium octaurelia TaxID=43137 RepID=A0A8S1VCM8_PAROT|nr:unnamed protein product [Paramecium octaurelia]